MATAHRAWHIFEHSFCGRQWRRAIGLTPAKDDFLRLATQSQPKGKDPKMTIQDLQSLLHLITSDRLELRGNEVMAVAGLQQRLAAAIQAASQPAPQPATKDSEVTKAQEQPQA